MDKSVIIIGGGLAGLAAGCYGRMNGYRTQIFEMHDIPGGVCTGWKRKGYTIDGAMNWLIGTKPGTDYNRLWQEVGAAQNWKVHNHKNYINIDDENGNLLTIPIETGAFEHKLLEISPGDEAEIRRFCKAARKASGMDMSLDKPPELNNFFDMLKALKMLPYLGFITKWGKITAAQYAARFKHPVLRLIFSMGNEESLTRMPAYTMPMLMGWLSDGEGGYIIGGALALVDSITERYRGLGGELKLKAKVDKIIVEDDRAVGIRLTDGTEHRADWIISAADGHATIFDMLDEKYIDDEIRDNFRIKPVYQPLVYCAFGLNRPFDDFPAALNGLFLRFSEPVTAVGLEQNECQLLIYNYDPLLAGEGKTVVIAMFTTDYDYWEKLYEDSASYKKEKKRISNAIADELDKRFPGFKSQIEMTDVATPVTWERYTGNWRGAYEGWLMTTDSMMKPMKKTLPGLSNFYMAGQWVNPGGGMPTAVMSGNHTIQLLCRRDGKKFTTSLP